MIIGITGANGFLARHLRLFFRQQPDVELKLAGRAVFADPALLKQFVNGCDAIIHLAGLNRADEEQIVTVNTDLARALVETCNELGATPHVLFASSIHRELDSVYGKAKLQTEHIFSAWAGKTGAAFTACVLPHVYGEGGKPFYNSVTATFCHQLAEGDKPEIIHDGQLELIHAQEVARKFWECLQNPASAVVRVRGEPTQVSALKALLELMDANYRAGLWPDLKTPLHVSLFNTYRSYLFPHYYPVPLLVRKDPRGELFETVKTLSGGQGFVSWTRPGVTRGNHYHMRKIERFLVMEGKALIRLRHVLEEAVYEFPVNGGDPVFVDMPTFYTHSIENVGTTDLVTLFWANEIFDPAQSDTYPEPVLKEFE